MIQWEMIDDNQYNDFIMFLQEKENIGIVQILFVRPRSNIRKSKQPCVVFRVLAGYYRRLVMPELQRIKPFKIVAQGSDLVTDALKLPEDRRIRVSVYF